MVVALTALLALLGYRAIAGTGRSPIAAIETATPGVVATDAPTSVPCACSPSGAEPTPLSTPASAATLARDWFWVNELTPDGGDGKGSGNDIELTVTRARFGALAAQTEGDATCIATGTYPSGARIVGDGLGVKSADSPGVATWTFAGPPAERGRAFYLLTCGKGPNQRTVEVLFDIP